MRHRWASQVGEALAIFTLPVFLACTEILGHENQLGWIARFSKWGKPPKFVETSPSRCSSFIFFLYWNWTSSGILAIHYDSTPTWTTAFAVKRFVEEPPLFCILGMHDLLVYKRGQLFPGIMAIRSWTSGRSYWTAEVETNDNPGTSAKRRQTYSQKSGFQTCKWQWIIWLSEKKHITKIHWLTSCILTTSYDGFFRSQTRAS